MTMILDTDTLWTLCFITGIVSFFLCQYGQRRFFITHPNERSSHAVPTSTFGGVAIWVSISIALSLASLLSPALLSHQSYVIFGCASVLMIVGALDDHKHIHPSIRFCTQIVFCGLSLYLLPIHILAFKTHWMNAALTLFLMMAFINAGNFSDGLNGLWSGTVMWWCVFAMIFLSGHDPFILFLVCAIFGFFILNFFKGSIFLGDSGSTFLGGCALLYGLQAAGYTLPLVPIENTDWLFLQQLTLVFSPFIFVFYDVVLTLLNRIRHGYSPLEAHKEHVNQILVHNVGLSHKRVSLIYISGSMCVSLYQIWLLNHGVIFQIWGQVALFITLALLWGSVRYTFYSKH